MEIIKYYKDFLNEGNNIPSDIKINDYIKSELYHKNGKYYYINDNGRLKEISFDFEGDDIIIYPDSKYQLSKEIVNPGEEFFDLRYPNEIETLSTHVKNPIIGFGTGDNDCFFKATKLINESYFTATGKDLKGFQKAMKKKIGDHFEMKGDTMYFFASEDEETVKELEDIAKPFDVNVKMNESVISNNRYQEAKDKADEYYNLVHEQHTEDDIIDYMVDYIVHRYGGDSEVEYEKVVDWIKNN